VLLCIITRQNEVLVSHGHIYDICSHPSADALRSEPLSFAKLLPFDAHVTSVRFSGRGSYFQVLSWTISVRRLSCQTRGDGFPRCRVSKTSHLVKGASGLSTQLLVIASRQTRWVGWRPIEFCGTTSRLVVSAHLLSNVARAIIVIIRKEV
jgi:hypothetical protein